MSKDTIHLFNNVSVKGIIANGSIGTTGQTLASNGTVAYWSDITGYTGSVGFTGSRGTDGYTGSVGFTGSRGTDGYAGSVGFTGSQGPIGFTGSWGGTAQANVNMNGYSINSANTINVNDIVATGNLTISGTTTYINTTNLNIGDNILTLNADLPGATAPTENSGIEVNRGSSANVQFIWDETSDRWTTNGQSLAISSLIASGSASGITTLAAGNTTITGFANVSVSVNSAAFTVGSTVVANASGVYATQLGGLASGSYMRSDVSTTNTVDVRAPIFYDSSNTAFYLDPASTSVVNNFTASYYNQMPSGVPRANLGSPTITEMALFDSEFNNKTEFHPISNIWVETSTDNITWTDATPTDANKRLLVGGDGLSNLIIPNGTPYFRIRMRATGYVYLNALYGYLSWNGHSTQVQVFKKHDLDTATPPTSPWTQHTNSTTAVSSWPGHLWMPMPTIPWHYAGTQGTHYHEFYILFIPTWNPSWPSNNINVYKIQMWGGYPAGKRNLYTTDEFGSALFPANTSSTVAINAPIFYDRDNTAYFLDAGNTTTSMAVAGNVGIGTTSPGMRLDVQNSTNTDVRIFSTPASSKTRLFIRADTTNMSYETDNSNSSHYLFDNTGGVVANRYIIGANSNWQFFTAGTERVRISNTGNFGIGNTAPAATLHVQGGVLVGGDGGVTYDFKLQRLNATIRAVQHDFAASSNSPWILHGENLSWTGERAGTVESSQAFRPYYEAFSPAAGYKEFGFVNVTSGNFTTTNLLSSLTLASNGNIGIGTNAPTVKMEIAGDLLITSETIGLRTRFISGKASPGNTAGPLYLQYNSSDFVQVGGGTGSANFYVANGNLGIGQTSPGARLDITSTTAFSARIAGPANVYQDITDGTGTLRLQLLSSSPFVTSIGSYPFVLGANNTEAMRITSVGNVGIGNSSPASKLVVAGNVEISTGGLNSVNGAIIISNTGSSSATITISTANTSANGGVGTEYIRSRVHSNQDLAFVTDARLYFQSAGANWSRGVTYTTTSPFTTVSGTGQHFGISTVDARSNATSSGVFSDLDVSHTANTAAGASATLQYSVITSSTTESSWSGTANNAMLYSGYNAGTLRYRVNRNGDIWTNGSITVTSTLATGNTTITGDLSVTGNTTLGDASADNVTINANTITIAANSNIDAGTLYIDSLNNRVGIGTTAPQASLHVAATGPQVRWDVASASDARHEYYRSGVREGYISWDANLMSLAATQTGGIINFASGGTTTRMTIAANGNIGIGNTAPGALLHVNGDTRLASNSTGGNWISFQRTNTNAWKMGTDGVGDVFTVVGNIVTFEQNVTIRRQGLTVTPTTETLQAVDISQTWNNAAATFAALKLNITDTASNTNSLLMNLQTGGTSQFVVRKDGNVGIGTSTPTVKLDVVGNALFRGTASQTLDIGTTTGISYIQSYGSGLANTPLVFYTGASERMRIAADGNVGIGSTNPAVKVVISNAGAEGYEINPTGGVGGGATVSAYNRSTSGYTTLTTYASAMTWYANGTTRAIDLVSNGNLGIANTTPAHKLAIAGDLYVAGAGSSAYYNTINNSGLTSVSPNGAQIALRLIQTGIADWSIYNEATTGNLRVGTVAQFSTNGNIGIGTATPAAKLHLFDSNAPETRLQIGNTLSEGAYTFYSGATKEAAIGFIPNSAFLNISSGRSAGWGGTITFTTDTTERIRIAANGNVGIGNTAPVNRLFVTGDIGLDGISVRDTATATTTAVTQITLFEYPIATYDSCDVIIKAVRSGERHTTKVLVTANSTVAIATEYGTLTTGSSLYTVDADISGANTRIRITPSSTTSTVFKASYELITT